MVASNHNSRDNELPNSMFCQNFTDSFRPLKSRHNYRLYTILQNKRRRWSASSNNNLDRVDEIQKNFMNSALGQVWRRNHNIFKFHGVFQKLLVLGGGGGGGHTTSAFYYVKLCVMINFSHHHRVLCFSFVVVLCFYAIIKVVLLDEKDCHV